MVSSFQLEEECLLQLHTHHSSTMSILTYTGFLMVEERERMRELIYHIECQSFTVLRYVVYDRRQVKMRYLLKVYFKFK